MPLLPDMQTFLSIAKQRLARRGTCLPKYKREWVLKSLAPQVHQSELLNGALISAKSPITTDPWRMPRTKRCFDMQGRPEQIPMHIIA
jgi:hypothetical protein